MNPPWVEGIRNTTYELALGLLERGHEVHFLTKGYDYHEIVEHLKCGIIFHRILTREHSGYSSGLRSFILGLPNAMLEIRKEYGIDILHAHSSYPGFGWYVTGIATWAYSKRIFSLYSCDATQSTLDYPSVVTHVSKLAKSNQLLKLSNINTIIVSSKKAFNDLVNRGFCKKKLHYIPVGIDTSKFRPKNIDETKVKDALNIPSGAHVLMFAGDLTPCKGVELFLSSLKALRDEEKNVIGLILTKGLYEHEQSRRLLVKYLVTKFNLEKNIRLIGIRNDIETLFNLSHIVVFPFLQSYALMDTPRALLEAMACGRPVVATRVGAIPEAIKHRENGLLIEPNNEFALKEAMAFLLRNDEEAKEIGANAASFISNNHQLSKMVSKIEGVYKLRD